MKNKNYVFAGLVALVIIGAGIWVYQNRSAQRIINSEKNTNLKNAIGVFSDSIQNLPEATTSQVVSLENGDFYNLEAKIVKKKINDVEVKMLAYNGSIPGPLIKVNKGSEITVTVTNNTDVGTTIHSHGVRLENKFDGVPDQTQPVIESGNKFTYKLKFPDEGIYWYHPHSRQDYSQDLGLYGNFLVMPTDNSYYSQVNREVPLFVDDIDIENGKIRPYNKGFVTNTLMGRFGNTMLVNGDTNYNFSAKQGEVVRFYITNSANTRTFNMTIPGVRMKLVGADNGKYEKETFVDSLVLSPSERAIIEVLFDKQGLYIVQHKTPEKIYKLGSISVTVDRIETSYAKEFAVLRTNQDTIASINPFRAYFDKEDDKSITLSLQLENGMMMQNEDMQMNTGRTQKVEWEDTMGMMNVNSTNDTLKWKIIDDQTKKENLDIAWQFKRGDKVKVKIFNDPKSMHPMQHPIHFHGQRFLALSTNGVKNANLVWKDTVLIQTGDNVELLVDMSNPGTWMAHCHISEHPEAGMMMEYKVI